ncbi:hypothetical protein EYF80_035381 [Liparis tanakae]|uniref:Uncharacterized protein n=1 Tax=Liparis tanakae TaxID=230148 RepID=A0A4Z2GP20_9TELE|nr:hypothetical protein EYF80_035381 [Liparis tanakae]
MKNIFISTFLCEPGLSGLKAPDWTALVLMQTRFEGQTDVEKQQKRPKAVYEEQDPGDNGLRLSMCQPKDHEEDLHDPAWVFSLLSRVIISASKDCRKSNTSSFSSDVGSTKARVHHWEVENVPNSSKHSNTTLPGQLQHPEQMGLMKTSGRTQQYGPVLQQCDVSGTEELHLAWKLVERRRRQQRVLRSIFPKGTSENPTGSVWGQTGLYQMKKLLLPPVKKWLLPVKLLLLTTKQLLPPVKKLGNQDLTEVETTNSDEESKIHELQTKDKVLLVAEDGWEELTTVQVPPPHRWVEEDEEDEGRSLAEHPDTKPLPLPLVDPHLLSGVQTRQHCPPLP